MRRKLRYDQPKQPYPDLRHQHDLRQADRPGEAVRKGERPAFERDQYRSSPVTPSARSVRSFQQRSTAESAATERLEECTGLAGSGEAFQEEMRDPARRR